MEDINEAPAAIAGHLRPAPERPFELALSAPAREWLRVHAFNRRPRTSMSALIRQALADQYPALAEVMRKEGDI